METRVLFVCLGNICRSPMAEGLFLNKIESRKLENIKVDSAGTSNYHIGERPDRRMLETANQKGVHLPSRARQFLVSDYDDFDWIIAMDSENKRNILSLARNESDVKKVHLMRSFDNQNMGANVPDPYFGGQRGFEEVFDILDRSTESLLEEILAS